MEEQEVKYRNLVRDAETAITESRRLLEQTAGMTAEEAKRELVRTLEQSARTEVKEEFAALKTICARKPM